ncbi:MAG: hypothetical protein K8T20_09935 [Planctomycetes bacterium]|nr:hypothetical protein [Planctomycetota bacterium]
MRIRFSFFGLALLALGFAGIPARAQTTLPYSTTFDTGGLPAGWTADAAVGGVGWAVDATPALVGDGFGGTADANPFSGTGSLNYNDGTDFDNGAGNSGNADSPAIDITGVDAVSLSFECNFETETTGTGFDERFIDIIDATTSTVVGTIQFAVSGSSTPGATCSAMGTWHVHDLNITPPGAVTSIRVRYRFNSVDSISNTFSGWFVDDLSMTAVADAIAPLAPTNVAPTDGATLLPGAVTLDWTDSSDDSSGGTGAYLGAGIASYSVEVASDAGFVTIVFSSTLLPSTATTPVLPAGTYFWHARATDRAGNVSPFSTTTTFVLAPPVALPFTEGFDSGSAPVGWGVTPVSVGGVGWTFDAIPGFVGVGDGDGASIPGTPGDANPFAGAGSANYNGGAGAGTTYDDGAVNAGSFTCPPLDVSAPGVICFEFECNFETDSTGGTFFDTRTVDILNATDGSVVGTIFMDEAFPSTPNALCSAKGTWHLHDLNISPPPGITAMEVRFNFSNGGIVGSDFYNGWFIDAFSVDVEIDTVGPLAPVNLTPADGSVLATGAIALDWTDADDSTPCGVAILTTPPLAASYDYEVATDAGFVTIVDSGSPATSNALTPALPVGSYYWHARGVDTLGNLGPYSATTTFTLVVPIALPIIEGFDAGAVPVGWGVTAPVSGAGWTFDAIPGTVGLGDGDGFAIPGTPGDVNPFAGAGSANYNGALGAGTTYDNGGLGSTGTLSTPLVDVSATTGAICLNFECNFETDSTGAAFFDARTIDVVDTGSGVILTTINFGDTSFGAIGPVTCSAMGTWHVHDLNVSPPVGVTGLQLRYRFDTITPSSDFYNGWFVDSFALTEDVDATAPLAVTNLTPPDLASLAAGPVTLDWTDGTDDGPCGLSIVPAGGIASYTVQVASDAAFTTIVFTSSVTVSTATTTPLALGTYFWRVQAVDRAGNIGVFSTTFSFNVVTATATPYLADFDSGSLPAGWVVSAPSAGGVGWAVDATPALVGDGVGGTADPSAFGGTGSSLNFNDGVDYDDGTGTTAGQASSPLLDISTLGGTTIFTFQCNYETDSTAAAFFDSRSVRVLDGSSLAVLTTRTFGSDGSGTDLCAAMGTYHLHTIDLSGSLGAATTIVLQYDFTSNLSGDLSGDVFSGWFVDDFQVTCGDTTPPGAAVNTTPADTAVVFCPPGVTLVWAAAIDSTDCSSAGNIASYTVEVGTANPPVFPFTFTTTVLSPVTTATTPVLAAGVYFWRVLATDTFGNSTYSTVTSFTVEVPTPTTAPDSLFVNTQVNGAQSGDAGFVDPVVDEQPVYSAIYRDPNTADTAIALRYQVSTDPTFATTDVDSGTIGISPLLPKDSRCQDLATPLPLNRNTIYFWRIQFTDSTGFTSPFSAAQSFRTGDDFDFGVRVGSTHHGHKKCYIATAAWGASAPETSSLRFFRSGILEHSPAGSVFSRWYATVGASLSGGVSSTEASRASVRGLLTPAATGAAHTGLLALIGLGMAAVLAAAALRRL